MPSSIVLHLIFGQYLSLNLELTNSARLTSSYSLSSTEIPELFTWLQGIWTQVLRFAVTFPVIFQFPPQLPYEINFPIIIQRNGFPCDVSIQTWYFVLIFPSAFLLSSFCWFPSFLQTTFHSGLETDIFYYFLFEACLQWITSLGKELWSSILRKRHRSESLLEFWLPTQIRCYFWIYILG